MFVIINTAVLSTDTLYWFCWNVLTVEWKHHDSWVIAQTTPCSESNQVLLDQSEAGGEKFWATETDRLRRVAKIYILDVLWSILNDVIV